MALSSGEAELNAAVKLTGECLGIRNMMADIGLDVGVDVYTDSSAAKGILTRRGCGKIKHLEAKQIWVQEKVLAGKVQCHKIHRNSNPSDLMTHNWTVRDASNHFGGLGLLRKEEVSAGPRLD